MRRLGTRRTRRLAQRVVRFGKSLGGGALKPEKQRTVARLVPGLFDVIVDQRSTDSALPHLAGLVRTVTAEAACLRLLSRRDKTLRRLIDLYTTDPVITRRLAHCPVLLSRLLSVGRLCGPVRLDRCGVRLGRFLTHVPRSSVRRRVRTLHRFGRIYLLEVTTSSVTNKLSLVGMDSRLACLSRTVVRTMMGRT